MEGLMARENPIAMKSSGKRGLSDAETKRILNHNLPEYILKRTVHEGHFETMECARIASKELMKYIILCLENPSIRIGMWSEEVDEVWHSYVLHTQEYFSFSRDILGIEYFHHTPMIIDEEGVSNMPKDGGSNFRRLYNEKFGHLPPIWDSMPEAMSCWENIDECCCY